MGSYRSRAMGSDRRALHRETSVSAVIAIVVLLLGLGCSGEADLGPQATRVYTPTGIDQTGVSDVTEELRAFFETVPDGSTVRFPADASYRVEGTLLFPDRHDFTIDRDNVQPMQPGRAMALLRATDSCDVIVSGNTGVNMVQEAYIEPYDCP